MEYDNRLLKLSRFIKEIISDSGLKMSPFHSRYGFGADGKPIVSASVFRALVNDPKSFPDKKTFDGLSVILSKSAGYDIPASKLMQLCDQDQPEYEEVLEEIGEIDPAPARADLLIKQFESLPYRERVRVSPRLLRAIADDDEYAAMDDIDKVAWLVKREMKSQGMGTERFAREFVGLPSDTIRAIANGEQVKLHKGDFLIFASRIHNIDGHFLLDEDQARRSIFAKVLASKLYIPC
jgi:hypothetical protein